MQDQLPAGAGSSTPHLDTHACPGICTMHGLRCHQSWCTQRVEWSARGVREGTGEEPHSSCCPAQQAAVGASGSICTCATHQQAVQGEACTPAKRVQRMWQTVGQTQGNAGKTIRQAGMALNSLLAKLFPQLTAMGHRAPPQHPAQRSLRSQTQRKLHHGREGCSTETVG